MNKIHIEDLGVNLHTGLRKACDSPATSIAWNIINLMDADWMTYLEFVHEGIDVCENVCKHIKDKSLSFREYMGNPHLSILHCSFKLFDDDDWLGYCVYVDE
jgi:hypothetical protein